MRSSRAFRRSIACSFAAFAHRQGDLCVKQRPAVIAVVVFIDFCQLDMGHITHLVFAHHGLEHGARPLPLPGAPVNRIEPVTALRHIAREGVQFRRLTVALFFQGAAEAVKVPAVTRRERLVKEIGQLNQQGRERHHILQIVGNHIFQQRKIAALQIAEKAFRGFAARQVVFPVHAEHALLKVGKPAGLQAEFPHPPRRMQKVKLVKVAPMLPQTAERIARLQKRHIKRLAVEGHGGIKARQQRAEAQKHFRLVGIVAQDILFGDELAAFHIGGPDHKGHRTRAAGKPGGFRIEKQAAARRRNPPAPPCGQGRAGAGKADPRALCACPRAQQALRRPAARAQPCRGQSLAVLRADPRPYLPPSTHFRRKGRACQASMRREARLCSKP